MHFIKRYPIIAVITIAIQFVLGTIASMYVEFPEGADSAAQWHFIWTSPIVLAHVLLGVAIAIGAARFLIAVWLKKQKDLLPYAASGAVAVFLAALGGERFVATQDDLWSLLMALGFLASIIIYMAAHFVTSKRT